MHAAVTESRLMWQLLEQRVASTPDACMLIEADGNRWSVAAFAQYALRIAAGLHATGIGPGTTVTWQIPTGVDALAVSMALARLGAVQNPVIHLYGSKEVLAILAQNRSSVYIVPAQTDDGGRDYPAFAAALLPSLDVKPQLLAFDRAMAQGDTRSLPPAPADAEAVRWVYYTSGTTAEPKGACHTDASLIASGSALADALDVKASDLGSITFPYAHVGGIMYLVMLLVRGMPAVILPKFSAAQAVTVFRRHGVTVSGGSTAHYTAFLNEQAADPHTPLIPTLSLLSGGGAPKPAALYFETKARLHCRIAHSYGMTEAPLIAGASPHHSDEQLAYSDGVPVAGMQIRITREDGSLADPGEAGEICVKGPTVCRGYLDPVATAAAFDAHGYFRTGDLGVLRPDGHIAITGRRKEVIIRKGENISAREVEDILVAHPKVRAVAVIGLPDEARGERVCAVVELRDPAAPLTFDEMVAFFDAAGAMRQKTPEQLEIVEQLPRNETFNKILKFKLRERFLRVQPKD